MSYIYIYIWSSQQSQKCQRRIYMDPRLATLKQSPSIRRTMPQHRINAERPPVSHPCANTLPAGWQSVHTQMWHRKPLCIDSVLKHRAANRKRPFQRCQTHVHTYTTLAFLASLGAPYIYEISSLWVNIIKWQVKFNPVA